jgi:hypothetical protein
MGTITRYDTAADTILPTSVNLVNAVTEQCGVGNSIVADFIGGITTGNATTNNIQTYTYASQSIIASSSSLGLIKQASSSGNASKGLVIGGISPPYTPYLNTVMTHNHGDFTFTGSVQLEQGKADSSATSNGTVVYLFGGLTLTNSTLGSINKIDIATTETLLIYTSLIVPRFRSAAIGIVSRSMVIGGIDFRTMAIGNYEILNHSAETLQLKTMSGYTPYNQGSASTHSFGILFGGYNSFYIREKYDYATDTLNGSTMLVSFQGQAGVSSINNGVIT